MFARLIRRIGRRFRSAPPIPPAVPVDPDAGRPDWAAWTAASAAWRDRRPNGRDRVLVATNIGGHGPVGAMESTLAAALALRSAEVEIVLCDGVLPGCLQLEHVVLPDPTVVTERRLPERACPACRRRGEAVFAGLGLTIRRLSDWIGDADRAEAARIAAETPLDAIPAARLDGIAVGEHARAGALRYYARGDLAGEPLGETVLRRYFEAAILATRAYARLIEVVRPTVAVFHHGLYVPQGAVGEVCRAKGVRVVNWLVAYRSGCFVFSHDDTYHHTLMTEPTAVWEDMAWGDRQRREIRDYLKSRWRGSRDWIGFHEDPSADLAAFPETAGLDPAKPVVGLLTNVVWDAQLHYPANAFPDMIAWVEATIRWFAARPDLQLLVRVHPAEIRGTVRSRQPIVEEIRTRFPVLPPNVFVVPPESRVSTYAALERCDAALIYGTKMGVELTAVGIPTIVAGEAWIKNKGLTLDADSAEAYFAHLARLPLGERLPPETVDRALRYAYHFFFRRMIPVGFMNPVAGDFFIRPAVASADDLVPGRDAGLDLVCDGILKGDAFVFPAERGPG